MMQAGLKAEAYTAVPSSRAPRTGITTPSAVANLVWQQFCLQIRIFVVCDEGSGCSHSFFGTHAVVAHSTAQHALRV